MRVRPTPLASTFLAVVLIVGGCSGGDGGSKGAADVKGSELVGLFGIVPAACSTDAVTGSWFRMVQPGGTTKDGPYLKNGDSTCIDQEVTPLAPGTDGGLRTGAYQPLADPAFDAGGNTTALAVITSTKFFAVGFGISTTEKDPQSGKDVPSPSIGDEGGELNGDLSAISVSWNGQHFNQGAPRPGGGGSAVTGTYDADTGAYRLDWTSLIKGGPFDGFTGIWHFEGTFTSS